MNRLLSTSAVLMALGAGSAAQAQSLPGNWYVSVFGGYSTIDSIDTDYNGSDVEHKFDDSYLLGFAVGTEIRPNLRAEVELSYSRYEGGDVSYNGVVTATTDGTTSATYLMGNLWYDIPSAAAASFKPYVGGGLGAVSVQADTNFGGNTYGYGDTVTGVAYQIGFGAQFAAGNGMIDVGYRLKAADGLDIDDNDGSGVYRDGTFMSSNLQVGYVIQF